MRPISDETLAQILARAAALLDLGAEFAGHAVAVERDDAHDMREAGEVCLKAARVLRGRA